jgi:serine/threonine-protein kinase
VRQEGPAAPPSSPIVDPDVQPRRSSTRPLATQAVSDDSTLASRGAPVKLPTPVPPPPVRPPAPSAISEEEQVATTLFDPDALLRAPKASETLSEDSMTLPRTSAAPPARRRPDPNMPVTEDSGTLPRDQAGLPVGAVSWNVRIAPTTKDPLCGRVIANGKYVLESVIGTGAIGIVFKASHRDLGRTVAIKVLNPRYRDDADLMQTFRSEARAASLLEHANVARVYDYGQEDDGLVYIVMEYLSGYTLGSVLAARKRLTDARALDVLTQVCAGLSPAHERGLVHRDIKPDNIVLVPAQDDEGQPVEIVKVCDFGIAVLGRSQTPEGFTAGSPEYMAPEQTTGSAVTAAADVYACGVVLYEMLVGRVPFTDAQPYRIYMKHQNEPPKPPSLAVPISPRLEALILRALEKQPSRRFQNARELRAELRRAAEPAT